MAVSPTPYRFALVAHSQELVTSVRAVADGAGYTLEYHLVDFETAVPMAQQCMAQGVEVILCHGGTGNRVVRALGNSAVAIDRTDMDVLCTLRKAAGVDREIVLAAHEDEHHDIAVMEELLNIKIHHVAYSDTRKLFFTLEKLYNKGVRVLVGGGVTKQSMDALGGTGFVIAANRHSIREALDRAKLLAKQKRRETALHENLLAIFRLLDQGVVCLDGSGKPVFINSKAVSLSGLKSPYNDEEAASVFRTLHLFDTLQDGRERKDQLTEIKGGQFVVTTLPITTRNGSPAAVALFRDVPSLQKITRKIGEELYSKGFVPRYGLAALKGDSDSVQALKARIQRFAQADAAVLIYGETGSGKELVAHSLHVESRRADKAFVAVNFASLPQSLLESELFGYEHGAFTGARRGGKAGLFELAHQGTLFLDEVGEMSHDMQLRLLRVMESKEVMRVGGNRFLPVDVRIISASHRSLPELVAQQKFRPDLYYRLGTLKLNVPPLREHISDLPQIVGELLSAYGRCQKVLKGEVRQLLAGHLWPGNVRELLAVIESYLLLLEKDEADPTLLKAILQENTLPDTTNRSEHLWLDSSASLKLNLELAKEMIVSEAVRHHGGDKRAAAHSLGVSYATLWRCLGGRKRDVSDIVQSS